MALKPIDTLYAININCQLKGAKLLKDVVKQSTIDDPGAVEMIIERLKFEIRMLKEENIQWTKAEDDDTETNIQLCYR